MRTKSINGLTLLFLLYSSLGFSDQVPAVQCVLNKRPETFRPSIDARNGPFIGEPLTCIAVTKDAEGDTINYSFRWWYTDDNNKSPSPVDGATSQTFIPTVEYKNRDIFCSSVADDLRGGPTQSYISEPLRLKNRAPTEAVIEGCPKFILMEDFVPSELRGLTSGCKISDFSDPDGDSARLYFAFKCPGARRPQFDGFFAPSSDSLAKLDLCYVDVRAGDDRGARKKGRGVKIPLVNRFHLPFASWFSE